MLHISRSFNIFLPGKNYLIGILNRIAPCLNSLKGDYPSLPCSTHKSFSLLQRTGKKCSCDTHRLFLKLNTSNFPKNFGS